MKKEEMEDFYQSIHKLKHTERNGWKAIGVKGVRDTIASHSFGASFIGWILSSGTNLDSSKIIKMLLMHDLIMSQVDDFIPHDNDFKSKREIENDSFKYLLKVVPDSIKSEITELFSEYQEENTPESRFARDCDKLDTLFQNYTYSKSMGIDKLTEFLPHYLPKLNTKIGKTLVSQLVQDLKSSLKA